MDLSAAGYSSLRQNSDPDVMGHDDHDEDVEYNSKDRYRGASPRQKVASAASSVTSSRRNSRYKDDLFDDDPHDTSSPPPMTACPSSSNSSNSKYSSSLASKTYVFSFVVFEGDVLTKS